MIEFIPPKSIKASVVSGGGPALELTVDPDGSPGDALTLDCLHGFLKESGAEDWLIDHEQVRLLRSEHFSLKSPKIYRIAECRDAQVLVAISDDRLEARISILAPYGGAPATEAGILEALKR